MAPISVVVAQVDQRVVIFGINETQQPVEAQLRYGVFMLAGGLPVDHRVDVTLLPNSSTELASFARSQWQDHASSAAFAMLYRGQHLIVRNRLFLPLLKELNWPQPQLSVTLEDGCAVFSSPTFVWGVCLDLDGETPLADNTFDVYPGIAHRIPWVGPGMPKVLHVGNLVPIGSATAR
jgi:hypothetical protein